MRVSWGRESWEKEKAYITAACAEEGIPANFSNSEEVFFGYVKMQSNFAYKDGFPAIAGSMRKAYNARSTNFRFPLEALWGI